MARNKTLLKPGALIMVWDEDEGKYTKTKVLRIEKDTKIIHLEDDELYSEYSGTEWSEDMESLDWIERS